MPIPQDNTLGNLAGILGSIPGLTEAINGKTTTSSTSIPSSGLNYLLQQILSSNQGLASVAGGQNTAGLYNSTVQTQMVNDLLARSAGEVASKTATTTTRQQPTLNLGDTLLQGAAGLIGSKLLSKGVDTLGSTVADALGLGSSGGAAAGSSLLSAITGSTAPEFSAGLGVPTAVANASLAGEAASMAGGAGAGVAGAAGSVGDAIGGSLASALGDTGAGALAAGLGSALGIGGAATAAATAGGLAAGGATLGGLGGAIAGDVAASSAAIASGMGLGAGAAATGGIGASLMSMLPAALAWVICTELETQGVMPHEMYHKAAPDFVSRMRLKPSAVRGYHFWAVGYTRIMRRSDWIGKLAVAAIKPLAAGRANYINGNWNILGWITFNILEPICSLLGNTIARKPQNWKSLYKKTGE